MQSHELVQVLLAGVEEEQRLLATREAQLRELAVLIEGPRGDPPGRATLPAVSEGPRNVVIVAANRAYAFYHQYCAYACQANRPFRKGITHMGFYTRGVIQPEIAEIVLRRRDVEWTEENAERLRVSGGVDDGIIASLIETTITLRDREHGARHDVFLLTAPDDDRTVVLPHAIKHAGRGRGSAWTQRQRYVSLDKLRQNPHTTDELGP